jgi:hypothetical protein
MEKAAGFVNALLQVVTLGFLPDYAVLGHRTNRKGMEAQDAPRMSYY